MTAASHYSPEVADGAVRFLSSLPHVHGAKAGTPLVLESWQEAFVRELFGTLREDGTRQYREAYVEVPRKNGKTFLVAGMALYLLFADGEPGANIYSAAKTREQASLAFDMAVAMIQQTPWLAKRCRIYRSPKSIYVESTNSKYIPLASDDGAAHGLNAHGIIFDELHAQKDRKLWDALQTSRGARRQPLTLAVTTAGFDRSSICWEKHQYAIGVRDGMIDDPTFLPLVYAAEPDDDWTAEATWRKANPNYGVSVSPDFLREECEKAKKSAPYENAFRNLYLDQWTEQERRWLKVAEWDACREDIDWSEFDGEPCWGGVDLSSTRDVTAFCLVFRRDDVFYVRPRLWIPEECGTVRSEQDQATLRNWSHSGFIQETSGNEIDYAEIGDWIEAECGRFDVRHISYDPWNATAFYQRMNEHGFDESKWRKFAQTVGHYAAPCKELERLLAGRRLRHDGNPVMRWMVGNTVAKSNANGDIRPDKSRGSDKIDGIVAMLMALGAALADEDAVIGSSVCWVPGEET